MKMLLDTLLPLLLAGGFVLLAVTICLLNDLWIGRTNLKAIRRKAVDGTKAIPQATARTVVVLG